MAKIGDRFKFVPSGESDVPAQIVHVTRVAGSSDLWCMFRTADNSEFEHFCEAREVSGLGTFEPVDQARAKQNDEISIEEWRKKIRGMG